jgi:methionyl-tRNA formyltransferase
MNLIFCGTPQFAVPTLEKLLEQHYSIELVLTNPDEPAGRGYEVQPSPVKRAAVKAGLPVFQPRKLKDAATESVLSKYRPDAMVVVAYGHIIPPWMIALPRLGSINLHASLLPKLRGAAPIPWAIIRGEKVTGITTMMIDAGLDTGPILLSREEPIRDDDVTESLSERLSVIGAELMAETLEGLERGTISPQPQDAASATLAPMLKKEDGVIDWSFPSEQISRLVRGLRPWPRAATTFRGKRLEIWMAVSAPAAPARTNQQAQAARCGTIQAAEGKLLVASGGGSELEVIELQLEGRKRLSARDFLNGVRLRPGEPLGG